MCRINSLIKELVLVLFSLSSFLFLFTDSEGNINKHYSFGELNKGLVKLLYFVLFCDLAKLL